MRFDALKKPALKINITPLIDVVFILLMFFMLATRFEQTRFIDIQTTESSQSPDQLQQQSVITLRIKPTGYQIDDKHFPAAGLQQALRKFLAGKRRMQLEVLSEPGSRVQQLVTVIDVCNRLGIDMVELQAASL